ncbi:MAG: glutamate-cysteine ligase family protein [Rhizonema sp. PD38]|nr:glutamate-cysteine ligase family protein [Rhizonema sp. PD38]
MIYKIGIELEIPLVKSNYLAADFIDIESLFLSLSKQGWKKKFDPNTCALIGVQRETTNGAEVLDSDFGICTFEVALAPVNSVEEAIQYWKSFKSSTLLPSMKTHELKMLGYGNQPVSSQLKHLISKKGHYSIYNNMISEDVREWFLQNFPGLSSVQFNFEISKEKVLKSLNTCFKLSTFIWAASANDPIANAKILPYKSQRFHGYSILAKDKMFDRLGLPPKPFTSLCEYIDRTWNVPIFEIIRDGCSLYPKNSLLTTNQFIREKKAEFVSLQGKVSVQEIQLEDLQSAIYFSWLDFRLKFNFLREVSFDELIVTVHSKNDQKLFNLVEYIILEVRPISMQSNEEEIDWLVLMYLILKNLEKITKYTSAWTYQDMQQTIVDAQYNGLNQYLSEKTLGKIGLDLLGLIPVEDLEKYEQHLFRLHSRFKENRSPSDDVIKMFNEQGVDAMLNYLTIYQ